MARYHVSGDGKPRKCTAASPESCPCAQKDENGKVLNHFDSEAEADRYGEKIAADGAKNAGSLSKNPLDAMAKHAPSDAPDDPAMRTALGALAMRGCTLEKQEDGRYKITDVDNDAMIGLMSDRGTFVDGAEVNDDGSVGIGITMNGSIPHWGAESCHGGGGDVSLEVYGDLLLRKNDDGEYELTPDNGNAITSRISFDPKETLEDFKYGANDLDLDEDDDEGWIEANDEAIGDYLSGLSDNDCDLYFGTGTSKWIRQTAADEVREPGSGIRERAALDRSTSARELEELSTDSDARVRWSVARNPNTPADALVRMSTDSAGYVRKAVARHQSTPVDVLTRMSDDPDKDIRDAVAENRSAPADLLAKLSTDSDVHVRWSVADNPSTPSDVLVKLSDDPRGYFRIPVSGNPSTPADVLARMSTDSSEYVRRNVARNPNTPSDVLTRMSDSPDTWGSVASNPSTPADVLAKLSTNSREYVRLNVASNPSTPPDLLTKLSTDSEYDVRREVTSNPNTPLSVLTKLENDDDVVVSGWASMNLKARRQKNNR